SEISFGVAKPNEIRQIAHVHVYDKNPYHIGSRKPQEYGVLDQKMGISTPDATCQTCSQDMKDCVGHFGYADLNLPTFHVGFINHCLQIVQAICKVTN
ncbi:MAG: transcription by RNA polymerase III, partial [Paramarteilia canceri]